LFLTTNLYSATTGLPMMIWIGPGYGAAHDVRIKVIQTHACGWIRAISRLSRRARRRTLVAGRLLPAHLRACDFRVDRPERNRDHRALGRIEPVSAR
jgi:hypothetical protein